MELDKKSLKEKGAYFTATEISRQPQSWIKTLRKIISQKSEALSFFNNILSHEDLQIVLSGAGSSAFIGDVLQYAYRKNIKRDIRALATTDLVTHFEDLIQCDKPVLLISFARSGNSPESLATIRLANRLCTNRLYHLIITCNSNGELATDVTGDNVFKFLLPEETEDQGLAMTNSFSSLMLAGFFFSDLQNLDRYNKEMQIIQNYGNTFLKNNIGKIRQIAETDFDRAIFLGSGPLLGIARESHLKLQELTDGKVICKYDSFLGFRHGPKAVVDDKTLVVYLISGSDYVRNYEMDLIREIHQNDFGEKSIAISENISDLHESDFVISLSNSDNGQNVNPFFLGAVYVMLAQLLGFYKSMHLGLEPDNPSQKGAISRVVKGVEIYPYDYLETSN